ncbi:unnamed protein product [Cylindrotheca closterium]|uniref:Uncharacterized protein n=1 Tax=Cylindrotheca closterium TaxID=2856 RepID=A0AAD2G3K4_9STRA|nr:unnamed protein product [Cylindrotheca closterium]
MTSYTYSGEDDEGGIPDDTDSLIVAEAVQILPINFCRHHIHLQQVVLPSSLGCIPGHAFQGCEALREAMIPSTVTVIGDFAFSLCTSLTYVRFPEGLKTIGKNSFASCAFTHLRIPGSLAVIEENAFTGCVSLVEVELIDGLKMIGQDAFSTCSSLRELRLPSTVEVIMGRTHLETASI